MPESKHINIYGENILTGEIETPKEAKQNIFRTNRAFEIEQIITEDDGKETTIVNEEYNEIYTLIADAFPDKSELILDDVETLNLLIYDN